MVAWQRNCNVFNTHVVAEVLITTLENKIYKGMTAVSKNINLDEINDKCKDTYHRTIKMKAANDQ